MNSLVSPSRMTSKSLAEECRGGYSWQHLRFRAIMSPFWLGEADPSLARQARLGSALRQSSQNAPGFGGAEMCEHFHGA